MTTNTCSVHSTKHWLIFWRPHVLGPPANHQSAQLLYPSGSILPLRASGMPVNQGIITLVDTALQYGTQYLPPPPSSHTPSPYSSLHVPAVCLPIQLSIQLVFVRSGQTNLRFPVSVITLFSCLGAFCSSLRPWLLLPRGQRRRRQRRGVNRRLR